MTDLWFSGSNRRSVSITSPSHSARTGASAAAGNTSRIPPRSENWPRSSTSASLEYPSSTRRMATVTGSGPRPGASSTDPSARSRGEIVCLVIARREETTMEGASLPTASAASASSRLFTASSNAGGRSRKEMPISANTRTDGYPASHGRSSSAKRSGADTRMRTGRRRSAHARATPPATIGQAGRGNRPTSRSVEAPLSQRSRAGAAVIARFHSELMAAPRSRANRRGCSGPWRARRRLRGPAPARSRLHR